MDVKDGSLVDFRVEQRSKRGIVVSDSRCNVRDAQFRWLADATQLLKLTGIRLQNKRLLDADSGGNQISGATRLSLAF